MGIEPHGVFEVVRPDEVAECWDGVFSFGNLYETLWGCTADYKAARPEVSEEPCYGMDGVAAFWGRFTPEQQAKLNELAETNH